MILGSVLDSKASFTLTALVVTWVAIVALAVIVLNMQLQLQRLGTKAPSRTGSGPYGQLPGRYLNELLDGAPIEPLPRLLLFLSNGCKACDRILAELDGSDWTVPTALVWRTGTPAPISPLGKRARVVPDGKRVSSALGIRVTPFVIVLSDTGQIVKSAPVNTLGTIVQLLDDTSTEPHSLPNGRARGA